MNGFGATISIAIGNGQRELVAGDIGQTQRDVGIFVQPLHGTEGITARRVIHITQRPRRDSHRRSETGEEERRGGQRHNEFQQREPCPIVKQAVPACLLIVQQAVLPARLNSYDRRDAYPTIDRRDAYPTIDRRDAYPTRLFLSLQHKRPLGLAVGSDGPGIVTGG